MEERISHTARKVLPMTVWRPLRALATALITPARFSRATGHWRSSIASSAMTARGYPLPWYTYPSIDFLEQRDFSSRRVLEFGGGQSTLWWSQRAKSVLTIEENEDWFLSLQNKVPASVDLHYLYADIESRDVSGIRAILDASEAERFDVIIVDGHLRREAAALAFSYLAPRGALILDNAEGYGFYEEIAMRNCRRVDFYGFAPGVSKRHCTSLVFVDDCFLLEPCVPLVDIERG